MPRTPSRSLIAAALAIAVIVVLAAMASGALGRTIEYMQIPMSEIRKNSDDFALMLEWFEAVGYDVDIAANAKTYGVKPTYLKEWASRL